ncbi:hypothetical protein [Salidesulfovibrio brasiliensis]|uniref:hypothetical protein n=1 Tax=Salidesulfovibrio brasiliensis TaxID=221711 RepID=UPI0006D237F5|nr:hypothetical protein [Salidesulfovibrio brasiliensis]
MPVINAKNRISYTAAAGQTAFVYDFLLLSAAHLEVYVDGVLQESGYTVDGAGLEAGGTVTFAAGLSGGENVLLYRNPPLSIEISLTDNDSMPADVLNEAFYLLAMVNIMQAEQLGRAILLPLTSSVSGVHIPEPEAGKVVAWSDDLQELVNKDLAELGALALPLAVEQGGTGCTTVAEALAALGGVSAAVANTWTKAQRYGEAALAIDAGVVLWDMRAAPTAVLTLTEDVTGIVITNPGPGELTIVQDTTGGWSVAWPAAILWPGGVAPSVTPDAGAEDVITFTERGGVLRGVAAQNLKAVA